MKNLIQLLPILILLLFLLACGTRKPISLPSCVFHQTDSGIVWMYRNSERAEVIGPFLIIPAPGAQDTAEVDYFPNGMQPEVPTVKWISHRFY